VVEERPSTPTERCTLVVPPDPGWLAAVRLFVAAVARRWDVGDDETDDLRLGVSELATAAMTGGAPEVTITVERSDRGRFRLSVEPVHIGAPAPEPIDPLDIVEALFDDVVTDGSRVIVTLEGPS
jgi:hypothetical protein